MTLRNPMGRRTPSVLQMENSECGAACLAMVLAAHGRWETLDNVRDRCGVSRDGISAADLIDAAQYFGLSAAAYRRDITDLRGLGFPQILFWGFDHFVVLEGLGRNHAVINDPAHGRRRLTLAAFSALFTGITLSFAPGPDFVRTPRPPGALRRMAGLVQGSGAMFAAIVLTSLCMAMVAVLVPGITKVFVDDYLVQGYGDWLAPLLIGLVAVGLLNAALAALHSHGLLLLQTKLSAILSARFIWRLFHLPHEFFARRNAVEVASRPQYATQVAGTISGPVAQSVVNGLSLLAYGAVMLAFSVPLTVLVLALAGVELAIVALVSRRLREEAAQLQMMSGQAHAITVQGAALLEEAKVNGTEALLFNRLVDAQVRLVNVEQTTGRSAKLLASLPYASSRLTTLAILGGGTYLVMYTTTTLGTVLGFLMLAGLFSGALSVLTGTGAAIGQTGAAMSRLGDALERSDTHRREGAPQTDMAGLPTGRIALADVGFAYTNAAPVFERVSLRIEPGQCVGITGASGGGKSTLARLIAGVSQPTGGTLRHEILRNGEPVFVDGAPPVGFVDQTPFLPSGSLRSALTLWSGAVDDAAILRALLDADIAHAVFNRPGGIDGMIGEGGGGFSGGERQRLAIARALLTGARVLVLDDATSALDEETEARVLENLRRRGITMVLFTNRASAMAHLDMAAALHGGSLSVLPMEVAHRAVEIAMQQRRSRAKTA